MWQTDLLIDAAEAALLTRESQLCAEQAVHGLDALDEVDLHPILAAGFSAAGFGIAREQPFPREWHLKRGRRSGRAAGGAGGAGGRAISDLPEHRDRQRCDLVVLPDPSATLSDPLSIEAAVISHRRSAEGTLFESQAVELTETITAAASRGEGGGTPPEDAYWLEIKLVAQFAFTAGFSGPNTAYASTLRRAAADLRKLDDDPQIRHAGLLVVLFTADIPTARHDLAEFTHTCLDRDLRIAAPLIRHIPIRERIGNHVATAALIDLRKPVGGVGLDLD